VNKQPEALRLASLLDDAVEDPFIAQYAEVSKALCGHSSAELRRQHSLIEELRKALKNLSVFFDTAEEAPTSRFERIAEEFHKATGFVAPGKDCRLYSPECRQAAYVEWLDSMAKQARAALAKAEAQQ